MVDFADLPGVIWRSGLSQHKPAFPLSKQYGYHEWDTGFTWISSNTLTWVRVGSTSNYWMRSVRQVNRLNMNIFTAPASIDGITLASGDRILLTAQSSASQNGLWIFNGAGNALTRPDDYAHGSTVAAFTDLMVQVYGTTGGAGSHKGSFWRLSTTGAITIGTTATAWEFQATTLIDPVEILAFPGAIATIDANLLSGSRNYSLPNDSGVFAFVPKFAVIEDQKATNTAGGTSVGGAWTTRILNTEVVDADGIVSISANLFTPLAGTYRLHAIAPFLGNSVTTGHGRIRLYNNTAATVILVSPNYGVTANQGVNMSLATDFVANGSDAYALQYYLTAAGARATNGLGFAVNEAGALEHYTQILLEKIG